MPPQNINTPQFWETYIQEQWVRNGGPEQTRLFAHYFLENVRLPSSAKTLLDCSCAMGDALPEFHRRYPHLRLHGADVSPSAVETARRRFASIATFEVSSLAEIDGTYDVIYCSNTLEHFENYVELARHLLRHCSVLYILVPFREMRDGRALRAADGEQHVATFDRHSFDALQRECLARRTWSRVIYAPGAWGRGPARLSTRLRAFLLRQVSPSDPRRQIIFRVTAARGERA